MTQHEHVWTEAGTVDGLGPWWKENGGDGGPVISVARCPCGTWKQETVWATPRGKTIHSQTEIRP